MRLNIYLISHPIVQLLSKSLTNKSINENIDKYKYINLFLFYEVMRKYLKIKIIYIKKLSYIQTLYMMDRNEEYYIITNLLNTYNIIEDIKKLTPNIKILNINNDIKFLNEQIINNLIYNQKIKKIIILEQFLNQDSIIKLIKILINDYNIYINNIYVISIACYNQILDKLGQKYPQLNIYTTEII